MKATICTVVTPMHTRLIGLNYHLIKTLNPDVLLSWNVVNNKTLYMPTRKRKMLLQNIRERLGQTKNWPKTKEEIAEADRLVQAEIDDARDPGEVIDYIPDALVIKGYKPKQLEQQFESVFSESAAGLKTRVVKYLASYLHAAGLNIALRKSKTRYSIVIDPDFYVVEKNWIENILRRMEESNLSVFGAPWNPRWYQKYRAFPCSHLMVIDHEKIPFTENLLSPELVRYGPKYVSSLIKELSNALSPKTSKQVKFNALKRGIVQSWRLPVEDWRQRVTIGASRDTGYKLFERSHNGEDFKFGLATPVFDPEIEGFHPKVVFPVQRSPLVEYFYPPERRYAPPKGTYSKSGFLEHGYPNFRSLSWEEFLLDEKPFAFHVRGELQRGKSLSLDLRPVRLGLDVIMQKNGLPVLPEPLPLENEKASAAA